MKLTLIISSLSSGGAERVMKGIANYWAKAGHDVSLITYAPVKDFYTTDDAVKRIRLNLMVDSQNTLQTV